MVNRLRDLISCLSGTIRAWKEFERNDIEYFHSNDEPSASSPSLDSSIAAVRKTFLKLEALLPRLQDLEGKLCNDNPQGVSHLSRSNVEDELDSLA